VGRWRAIVQACRRFLWFVVAASDLCSSLPFPPIAHRSLTLPSMRSITNILFLFFLIWEILIRTWTMFCLFVVYILFIHTPPWFVLRIFFFNELLIHVPTYLHTNRIDLHPSDRPTEQLTFATRAGSKRGLRGVIGSRRLLFFRFVS
jgi:hypothetical protein